MRKNIFQLYFLAVFSSLNWSHLRTFGGYFIKRTLIWFNLTYFSSLRISKKSLHPIPSASLYHISGHDWGLKFGGLHQHYRTQPLTSTTHPPPDGSAGALLCVVINLRLMGVNRIHQDLTVQKDASFKNRLFPKIFRPGVRTRPREKENFCYYVGFSLSIPPPNLYSNCVTYLAHFNRLPCVNSF